MYTVHGVDHSCLCNFQILLDKETLRVKRSQQGSETGNEEVTISLAARWFPKGRATDRFTKMTKSLARKAFNEEFNKDFKHAMNFGRTVTELNREINTTEQLMCAKKFK